jgi:glycosyltransferase involved in cell wall biosynthesis
LERSLSALLPVHNAQTTLAATVQEFLEILPELTRRFEVVIADDGSTDATIEVADELANYYPQVLAIRHATRRGRVAAIGGALERSTGEILLVKDDECGLSLDELHRLWRVIDQHEIVLGRVAPSPESRWPAARLPQPEAPGGLQMLSRRVIGPITGALTNQTTLLAALAQQGYTWHEVQLAACRQDRAAQRASVLTRQLLRLRTNRAGRPARTDPASAAPSGPKRPNYLAKLKDFALGE